MPYRFTAEIYILNTASTCLGDKPFDYLLPRAVMEAIIYEMALRMSYEMMPLLQFVAELIA